MLETNFQDVNNMRKHVHPSTTTHDYTQMRSLYQELELIWPYCVRRPNVFQQHLFVHRNTLGLSDVFGQAVPVAYNSTKVTISKNVSINRNIALISSSICPVVYRRSISSISRFIRLYNRYVFRKVYRN